ncbi:MAG: hypothetical protein WC877_01235 [Dehalococcoidales bacterium]|jgi:hypothetical protein
MPQKTTNIPTKFCYNCKQYKPINEFGKNVTKSDGLQSYCKTCSSIRAKQSRKNITVVNKSNKPSQQTKLCPKCQQIKPTTEFSIDNAKGDGLQTYCKSCQSIRLKQSRSNKTKTVSSTITTPSPSISEFKGSSITKQNFNDISQVYIDKYVKEIKGIKEVKGVEKVENEKQLTTTNISLDDLILEAKVKLTILNHLKEVKED